MQARLRRLSLLLLAPLIVAIAAAPAVAVPEGQTRHHALSLVGEPKFPADYKHFDWANPEAPRGGVLSLAAVGGFDSLNGFSIKGVPAAGIGLIFDALMASSPDEPSAEYGLIAEWVSFPEDFSTATFGLRPEARFHDGKPITVDDVIFSLDALKKAHPHFASYYKNVVKAEKTGENEVTFTFDKTGNRELPHILGQLPVLPKHYWEANGKDGQPRDLSKSTSEVPLGSGPYKVKSFEANRGIIYERVKDYWAQNLPVMLGQNNFDEYRFTYYRDNVPAFEAFKTGDVNIWPERSATSWATQYGFDAVKKGWVIKEELAHKRVAPMQAFVFNIRRPQFADPRVRRAFNLAFNFEEANQKLFYGTYVRVGSYFDNSDFKASGLPQGRELEILTEVKDQVPPEVFTTEYKNPVNSDPKQVRENMMQAKTLLAEAGWTIPEEGSCGFFCSLARAAGFGAPAEQVAKNSKGEPLTAEFLINDSTFERIVVPYVDDLKKIGVKGSVRIVDPSQYERREQTFDYDIIVDTFSQSHSPGNEQRDFWGSAAADRDGSRNTIGIKNPAIDHLIEKIVFATSRDELVAATKALDRVLLWNHYVVPEWYAPAERIASWNIFGRPDVLPSQDPSYFAAWWIDPEKQKALEAARGK
jgi:microcin C transport system substrate-binding protein